MSITLIEYNKRLNGVISDLQSGANGQVMAQVASNAIASIKQRIQEKGLNAEGTKYPAYSKGYLKRKTKEGKYKGFVDFTLSSRMWGNIKLVSDKGELDKGTAVIKGTTQFEQDKLNWNTEKKGEILALSKKEITSLVKTYETGIMNIWRKNKLT